MNQEINVITVTKEYHFDAAHRLTNYIGACSNIHGHSYRVQICFERGIEIEPGKRNCEALNDQGMVVDFKDIYALIGKWIDEHLDHALILDKSDTKVINSLNPEKNGFKVHFINGSPTAENMAIEIFNKVVGKTFEGMLYPRSVKVWETPTSFAEVRQ